MPVAMLWERPPITPDLTENKVVVWCADLDLAPEKIDQLTKTLSADEQQRADRFVASRHRQHFTAARGILRQILGHYLQQAPQKLAFAYQEHGKPMLSDEFKGRLFFNLAHSQEIALYALCLNKELGVDIEQTARNVPGQQIAQRFFSEMEYETFMRLPIEEQPIAFFNCWTRKEAFIKAIGAGLSYSLRRFEVNYLPRQPAKLNRIDGDEQIAAQWALFDLQPAEGYVGALALTKPVTELVCYRWDF
ncbi:MAG: 4'-phosphopantetheinyl transferase superfamily protein [Gammaproteobacteria bacterium]